MTLILVNIRVIIENNSELLEESFRLGLIQIESDLGYYMKFQDGRYIRKKQPYYADHVERLNNLIKLNSPGPGFYSIDKNLEKRYIRRSVPRPRIINEKSVLESINEKVGPGTYNVEIAQTKPRIKGIPAWKSISHKKRQVAGASQNTMDVRCEFEDQSLIHSYVHMKELSSFASKVPRFQAKPRLKPILRERVIITKNSNTHDTSIVIQRSLDNNAEIVIYKLI